MNKTTNINTVYATKNNSFSWNRVKMLSNFTYLLLNIK